MSDKEKAMKIINDARTSCPGTSRDQLHWDDSLASQAEEWAKHCAEIAKMEHSSTKGQGENLYGASPKATFEAAAKSWIGEKSKYHGQPIDKNFAQYGHYTQCVWPSTTKVGMGSAKSKDGWEFICARFTPPGNMMGKSAY